MHDYTFDELESMQQQALDRVRNMQSRARAYIEDTAADMKSPPQRTPVQEESTIYREPAAKEEEKQEKKSPVGRISMPLNLPKERESVYPDFKSYFAPHNEAEKASARMDRKANLMDAILKEPDKGLLFVLLLLFNAEGHNETILMAILYILL